MLKAHTPIKVILKIQSPRDIDNKSGTITFCTKKSLNLQTSNSHGASNKSNRLIAAL